MSNDIQTYKRAVHAAILGLGVQIVMSLVLAMLALNTHNAAVESTLYFEVLGLPLWVCLVILFQQYKLERIEALEFEQIADRHGTDSSIFETAADDLRVQQKRLAWLHRWIVPLVGLLTAGALIGVGAWHLSFYGPRVSDIENLTQTENPLMPGVIFAALTVLCFLVSRYLAGMAKVRQWELLRGGAGYVMGGVALKVALAVCFGASDFEWLRPLHSMSVIVPVFMIVIGVEMALNFILDFYRPRRAGELPRPAFDSRLLNLLTSPESVAKTINEAIDFQFGFKITENWFWQLLSKWFWRLIGIACLVFLIMSCFVFVQPNQQAVRTTFGALSNGPPLGPGLRVKMPWPIQKVEYYDVTDVRTLHIGSHQKLQLDKDGNPVETPILWTNEHGGDDINMIVAPPAIQADDASIATTATANDKSKPPSISLVNAEVIVHYRIGDLVTYIRSNADAENRDPETRDQRLGNLAVDTVSRMLLRHTIDEWIGTARVAAGTEMRDAMQEAADQAKLGLEILSVTVASVHPPQKVADKFHEVVSAEQERQTSIEKARQKSIETMVKVAGSVELGEKIVAEIDKYATMTDEAARAKQAQVIELLMRQAGGSATQQIAEASGFRWDRENTERGKAERFAKQYQAYKNAPRVYMARQYFEALEQGLPDRRKFLFVGKRGSTVIRGDFKDTTADITNVLEHELNPSNP
ncbi:MAG: hypothetical protein GC159_14755 [Phycisphaera sp.]|nr:hypothetical protein [Phycisphaera sp.]